MHVFSSSGGPVRAVERDAAAELRGLVLRGGSARDVCRADRRVPLWGERNGERERGDHAARVRDGDRVPHAHRGAAARPEPALLKWGWKERKKGLKDIVENLERPALFLSGRKQSKRCGGGGGSSGHFHHRRFSLNGWIDF